MNNDTAISSGLSPLRLDGMQLCLGCEEAFVLEGYCPGCLRLVTEYALKEKAVHGRFGRLPRVDIGSVDYGSPPTLPDCSFGAIALAFLIVLALPVLTFIGAWVALKWAILLVLRKGW